MIDDDLLGDDDLLADEDESPPAASSAAASPSAPANAAPELSQAADDGPPAKEEASTSTAQPEAPDVSEKVDAAAPTAELPAVEPLAADVPAADVPAADVPVAPEPPAVDATASAGEAEAAVGSQASGSDAGPRPPFVIPPAPPAAPRRVAPIAAVALVAAIVLAFVIGAADGPQLAESVPSDVQFYVEAPSVVDAVEGLLDMDIVREDGLSAADVVEPLRAGLADAFGLGADDAMHLLSGVESVAFIGRNLMRRQQSAIVIAFDDPTAVERLLTTDRFDSMGRIGSGTRFALSAQVDPNALDPDARAAFEKSSPWKKLFATSDAPEKSKASTIVWFADDELLVIGHKLLAQDIDAVLESEDESLADQPLWKDVRFESDSSVVLFVDSELVARSRDRDIKRLARGYFSSAGPLTGWVQVTDPGVLSVVTGQMRGEAIEEGDEDAFSPAIAFDIHEQLPAETVAYVALSTDSGLDGKDVVKRVLRSADDVDETQADRVGALLDGLEEELGIGADDIFDALGDQMAIAVAVDRGAKYDAANRDAFLHEGALAVLAEIDDESEAKRIVRALRNAFDEQPLEAQYDLSKKGLGFNANPVADDGSTPPVFVRLEDDHLLIAVGAKGKRFVEALLDGENTLDDDDAHANAMSALSPRQHVLVWGDAGWATALALDVAKADGGLATKLEDTQRQLGLSTDALVLQGDDRMTFAMAVAIAPDGDVWDYRVETLNLPAIALPLALAVLTAPVAPPPAIVSDAAVVPAPVFAPASPLPSAAPATAAASVLPVPEQAGPSEHLSVIAEPGDLTAPGTAVLPEGQAPPVVDMPASGTAPSPENAN
jgi:hypothetical protein